MSKRQVRVMTDAERQMFESLRNIPAGWTATRVTKLSTDDSEVAQTYADMMAKRRELHPQALTPPTLGELFGLANAYLARSGRQAASAHIKPSVTKTADEDSFGASGSPLSLWLTEISGGRAFPGAGDILLWVRADRQEALATALGLPAVRKAVKWESEIERSGILPTLLPRFAGILYLPDKLNGIPASTPLGRLFVTVSGTILLVAQEEADRIGRLLGGIPGVSADSFASLTADEETTIVYSPTDILRVDSAQLRALTAKKESEIRIPVDATPAGALTRFPVAGSDSPYLQTPDFLPERVSGNGFTVAAAVRQLCGSVFRAAMAATLAPLLSLAAAGTDYPDIRLGIGLRFPLRDGDTENTVAAAILGIYRAQIEFATPAALFAERDDSLTAPELTVWAFTKGGDPVPAVYRAAGNSVFCVTPVMTDAGIPNFPLLRQLLTEIHMLSLSGALYSARTAIAETLGSCLAHSAGNGLTCRLADPDSSAHRFPIGFILEGSALPFSRIGTTETTVSAIGSKPIHLPEKIGKYIWSDRYEITVLSAPDDAAAASLVRALQNCGADCIGFCDRDGAGPASRRILTSRILILCPGASLPKDPQTVFALRMLTSNGGIILRIGEQAPKPDGFPSQTVCGGLECAVLRTLREISH